MADINLLPEEFRAKDKKAREESTKKTIKVELSLTSPDKSKDKTVKKNFWKKITGALDPQKKIKNEQEHARHFAPAQKRLAYNRKAKVTLHEPEHHIKTEDKPKELTIDKQDKDEPLKRTPLINPYLSDFQQETTPRKPHAEKIGMHKPEISEKPSKQDKQSEPIDNIKFETKPSKKLDIQQEKEGIVNKAARFSRNIVFTLTHKKEGDKRIRVNLMPARRLSLKEVNWARILNMLLASVGGAIVVTVLWYLVLLDKEQQSVQEFSDIQYEIASLKVKLRTLEDDQQEALLLKNKLDSASTLLDNHIYWSRFLSLLEEWTLDGVYFLGLTADNSGSNIINLLGIADNLETVYWQRETFKESDAIVDVAVLDARESTEGSVEFSIRITVQPSVFHK